MSLIVRRKLRKKKPAMWNIDHLLNYLPCFLVVSTEEAATPAYGRWCAFSFSFSFFFRLYPIELNDYYDYCDPI